MRCAPCAVAAPRRASPVVWPRRTPNVSYFHHVPSYLPASPCASAPSWTAADHQGRAGSSRKTRRRTGPQRPPRLEPRGKWTPQRLRCLERGQGRRACRLPWFPGLLLLMNTGTADEPNFWHLVQSGLPRVSVHRSAVRYRAWLTCHDRAVGGRLSHGRLLRIVVFATRAHHQYNSDHPTRVLLPPLTPEETGKMSDARLRRVQKEIKGACPPASPVLGVLAVSAMCDLC